MTKFVCMSVADLNKEIASISKVGAKLNIRIQVAALNAIFYSIQHGDVDVARRLYLAMNAGQRRNSLVAFLEKHGKIQWNSELKQLDFKKRDDLAVESIDTIAEQWHEAMKEPTIKSTYDFDDDAAKFIKRMEKAINAKAAIKNVELFDYIQEAVAKYHAEFIAALPDDVEEEQGEPALM